MKFYSWKDIERWLMRNKEMWNGIYSQIEVYPSVIIAYNASGSDSDIDDVFYRAFPKNYISDNKSIRLDFGEESIGIIVEQMDGNKESVHIPLFKEVLYDDSSYRGEQLLELNCPVIGFHSYKGGVGRTLSLIAFAKAWSAVFENEKKRKLLIVDADIEAPGLTWIQESDLNEDSFSYLDLLMLIQDNDVSNKSIIDLAVDKIETSYLSISTPNRIIDHVFLPTYRYTDQLLDIGAMPETVIYGKGKQFIITDVLSKIGEKLGAGAVLVDLRAGLCEHSAPLLLDYRVKKYIVSSTSRQSISGTQLTLDFIMKGLTINADSVLPEIFINMIPDYLSGSELAGIKSQILRAYDRGGEDESDYTDNVITELPFASELVHLTTFKQILNSLNEREMYLKIKEHIQHDYSANSIDTTIYDEQTREQKLKNINRIASQQIAAEGDGPFNLMITEPLKHLGVRYQVDLPSTIIMGAKGSGKTFIYKKLIESKEWGTFFNKLNFGKTDESSDTYFIPIIATRNATNMITILKNCIDNANSAIDIARIDKSVFLNNGQLIHRRGNIRDWYSFWERLIVNSFNEDYSSLSELDQNLRKLNKKILFLIDGLEEYFTEVYKSINEKDAIRSLCQDIVTNIRSRCSNIGIIVFLRRDLAQNAISVNYTQFRKTYEKTELKWSYQEALRLAVWLVKQADPSFYKETVDINEASSEVIDRYLTQLWGLKLGKSTSNEANSSRWILAALSDFNGQLQARDIIRFLQYASNDFQKRPIYNDRLLMPVDIKTAVQRCSIEKMSEIKDEYKNLKPIFEKLENLPVENKVLPLRLSDVNLSSSDEKALVQEGYLKRDGEEYYLPEIVRHALGFKYGKGARPRVLALTLKN